MDVMELANGPMMWVFALGIVGVAILQSLILYKLAMKYNSKAEVLTKEEVKTCLKVGGVVSIGPALSVFVVALSMISMLGAPLTLMRIGMIGSASTELTAASIGAEMAGVTLGIDALTSEAFTAALWTCAIMSCGYLIFVPLVTRGIGNKVNNLLAPKEGKKSSKVSFILGAILPLALFAMLAFSQIVQGLAHAVSFFVAAIVMLATNILSMKLDKKWIREWSMCIAVFLGIIIGGIINALV